MSKHLPLNQTLLGHYNDKKAYCLQKVKLPLMTISDPYSSLIGLVLGHKFFISGWQLI